MISLLLAKHAIDNNHHYNFDNDKVVTKETIYTKRLVLEVIHIKPDQNSGNNRSDIQNLFHVL